MRKSKLELAKLLSADQVAELLDIDVQTLYRWTKSKRIGFIRAGRHIKFHPDHVTDWMNQRQG
jgi:excisionase family DNA binding protein